MSSNWREAAREAMYEATLQEAEQRYGTRRPVYNYRWEHVQAVVKLALRLAALTGADVEVVEAAGWLHDIRKDEKERHAEAGAVFARNFLPQTDFPAHKVKQVARVIAEHMGLWREEPLEELEAQVLWDADKLAKIGLTAAFHWLGLRFACGEAQTTLDFVVDGRSQEWLEKTVASMHTGPARRAAQARLEAYNGLWNALEGELEGDDLG